MPSKKLRLMRANEAECNAAGMNPQTVEKLARDLSKLGRKAERMGLTIFGGSGSGTLRYDDPDAGRSLILASIEGIIDGGDGAAMEDDDGLLRGE